MCSPPSSLVQRAGQLLHSLSLESRSLQPSAVLRECELVLSFLECLSEEGTSEIHEGAIGVNIIRKVSSNRICNQEWLASRPSRRWSVALLRLTRTLVREKLITDAFHDAGHHLQCVKFVDSVIADYLRCPSSPEEAQIVALILNVLQKLCNAKRSADLFVEVRLHKVVLQLLVSREMAILQATLEILGRLSDWSATCRSDLCASTAVDICLQLSAASDLLSQKLCVSLLRILSCEDYAREQIKIYDGIPLLVSLLSVRNSRLQWHVAWTLAQLADDSECALEIGQRGAVAVLLAELAMSSFPPSRAQTDWLTMLSGFCALLAQLCQVDSNETLIMRNNGLFILGQLLLLPLRAPSVLENTQTLPLLCSVFRVLRLLFSLERNRHFFRKVFDAEFFALFIDIGHYVQDLPAYRPITEEYLLRLKTAPSPDSFFSAWETVNQQRAPLGEVGEYELLEQLGAGAFGCVYSVRKKQAPLQFYALKEIYMMESKEISADKSFGDVISEVRIIKQQLRHANIVRYRRIFVENSRLYIVMDLIDGASLKEHIHSTAEKKTQFSEARIWNILVQLVLALRYLHKDKRIVHRDLKPNNIILAEGDRVVITDFGLAKQRGADYLKSAAGTIVYSCPEIVQNLPYGDKADVWSLGCCIYELCNLVPSFFSQNILKLTMLIVEGKFDPVNEDYSQRLRDLIGACLRPDPAQRPDIIQVGEMMAERLLIALDEQIRLNTKKSRETTPSMSESGSSLGGGQRAGNLSLRSESLSSSFSSEQLSSSLKESRGAQNEKRLRLPPVSNNCNSIDKIGKPNSQKSFSAGSRPAMPLSCSLPRLSATMTQSSGSAHLNEKRRAHLAPSPPSHGRRASSSSAVENRNRLVALRSAALRPVSDPMLQMLAVLHRLLLVCEQPQAPSDTINHKRRVLEHFRKRLFGRHVPAESIKTHMRKLATESPDDVSLELGYADFRIILSELPLYADITEEKVSHLTYEQLAAVLKLAYSQLFPQETSDLSFRTEK